MLTAISFDGVNVDLVKSYIARKLQLSRGKIAKFLPCEIAVKESCLLEFSEFPVENIGFLWAG
jgi:hypothetical protein